MRRAVIALAGTAVGVGAVLSYQPLSGQDDQDEAAAAPSGEGTGQDDTHGKDDKSDGPDWEAWRTVPTDPAATGEWVPGDVVPVKWGDVQVRVRLDGTRITDVNALALPDDDGFSARLSQQVARTLREEVLQARSTDVDMVSGATYSSRAYLKSLQSALDRP